MQRIPKIPHIPVSITPHWNFIAPKNLKSSYPTLLHTLQLPFTTHIRTQVQLPKDREQQCVTAGGFLSLFFFPNLVM